MRLHHLEYLKCFCSSGNFSAYSLEAGGFRHQQSPSGKVIDNGLIVCSSCLRAYPINDGILHMLPENLADQGAEEFLKKHSPYLPKNVRLPEFASSAKVAAKDPAAETKQMEMKARDKQAGIYHTFVFKAYAANEQRVFMDFLKLSANDVVVELGCGTGKITGEIIKAGVKHLIATDFSEESIRLLLGDLDKTAKDNVLFIKADVCNLPLRDHISEKALSAQVFEHIPGKTEQGRFITELKRILKPDGVAAVTTYNFNLIKKLQRGEKKGYHDGEIYFENFTRKEVSKAFEPHFSIRKISGINCYFPFVYKTSPGFQRWIEYILSRGPFSCSLGKILFLGLTQKRGSHPA